MASAASEANQVSSEDRERMARLARDLDGVEVDEPPSPSGLAAAVAAANRDRLARGRAALEDEGIPPEEHLYRRARAIGLRRRRG